MRSRFRVHAETSRAGVTDDAGPGLFSCGGNGLVVRVRSGKGMGQMTISVRELVSLDAEERSERFVWIDWRSFETEVIEGIIGFLGEDEALDFQEGEDGGITVLYNARRFAIPLTHTGSDRYVMISSMAEILKDSYVFWLDRESAEGADTHGFLLLTHAQSEELRRVHADWAAEHLLAFEPGFDHFHGIKVPFLHHPDHNPDFIAQRQAMDEGRKQAERVLDASSKGARVAFFAIVLLVLIVLALWVR